MEFYARPGGTFTDIIAIRPDGEVITKKVLSSQNTYKYNPISYGINLIINQNLAFKKFPIDKINIGTTIGTNTLLERKGDKLLLCVTKGFKDNFIIGNQKEIIYFLGITLENHLYILKLKKLTREFLKMERF